MSTGPRERTLRLRLGLFVLLALGLLAALVVMFGSLPNLFKRSTLYTARFTEAPGIGPGTPVRRSGVRIGTVRAVTLDDERGIVRVQLAIDPPYRIRNNEVPTIVAGLLGSDAAIDFIPKPAEDGEAVDRNPVEPGAELVGARAANVGTLLRGASEVVPTTQETLNDIRKSMQRIEKLAARWEKATPLAEDTLREYRDLARSARETLPELRRTNAEVRELARAGRQALPELLRTNEEVREFARQARLAVPELRQTNKEVGELAKAARQAVPELQRTNEEVRATVVAVRKAIPTVEAAVEDVAAAARNWGKLGERLDTLLQTNQDKVVKALEDFNQLLGRANRLLSDENLRNVEALLTNARTASEQLPSMAKSADDILTQGRVTVRRLNDTLLRLDATLTDVQKFSRPFTDRSDRISRNLDEVLVDVRALLKAVDKSNGTLQKFLKDPSLYNHLDQAAVDVSRLVPRLDRILKDFEVFADKLARHPEAVGIGGVVRPGSGLKNPPSPPAPPPGSVPPGTHLPHHR